MAKNDNVKDFTKDIADAIRAKENSVAKINPQDFSARIAALSVGGSPKFAELVDGSITTIEESDLKDVESIASHTFMFKQNLVNVEIPSNVKSIGELAFMGTSVETLTLAEGIETISNSAFLTTNIQELVLPSSLINIGEGAFSDIYNLEKVTIKSGITNLPNRLFDGCDNLTDVYMESTTPPSVGVNTFPSTAQIYVLYGAYDDYVASWTDYASQIVRLPAIPSSITVIVNNYLGELVSGASVTISGNGQTYTGTTDSVGTFTQGDLQPATYSISVADMEGLKTPEASEVVVEEDTQNSVTVTYLEKPAQTPFAEATWQEISNIADEISRNNMTATEVEETYGWKLGDTKSETMSNGETIDLQIIGFCHDRLVSGIGYAGITLQTVGCLETIYPIGAKADAYGWADCDMRLTTLPTIKSMFTQELQANIVPVNKIRGYYIIEDELFLLSEQEVFGTKSDQSAESSVDEGPQYAYWADHNTPEDRVKSDWGWYLRTMGKYKAYYWCCVTSAGGINQDNTNYDKALSFALCLGSFERDPSKKSFSDYTPAEISEISSTIAANNMTNKQIAETYGWYLGDTTTIPLTTGENITVRIIGFNHDNLSDGSGKAGVTLQMVDTLKTSYSLNKPDSATGGWGASQMRTTSMPSIKVVLPQDWQDIIKLVDKKYANGTGAGYTGTLTSSDDLFLLSAIELYGDRYNDMTAQAYYTEGSIYEYWQRNFALGYRQKKYDSDGDGTPETNREWWLRSLANNYDPYWRLVKTTGGIDLTVPRYTRGVSFAFCIGSAADYVPSTPEEPSGGSKVYGVEWVNDASTTMTRTDDAVGMTYTKNTSTGKITSDFDHVFPYNQMKRQVIDGNTFVYVPSMWFRVVVDADKKITSVAVSETRGDGDNWYQTKPFYYGAYGGSASGNYLKSVSNQTRWAGMTRPAARQRARSNGNGYHLRDLYSGTILMFLWWIEFATKDSGSVMTGVARSSGIKTGTTDEIYNENEGNAFCVSGYNTSNSQTVWHGIEDYIGNGYEWEDGVTGDGVEGGIQYVSADYTIYDDYSSGTKMSALSFNAPTTDGACLEALGWDETKPFLCLPIATRNDTTYTSGFCDSASKSNNRDSSRGCVAPTWATDGVSQFGRYDGSGTSSSVVARLMKEV